MITTMRSGVDDLLPEHVGRLEEILFRRRYRAGIRRSSRFRGGRPTPSNHRATRFRDRSSNESPEHRLEPHKPNQETDADSSVSLVQGNRRTPTRTFLGVGASLYVSNALRFQ